MVGAQVGHEHVGQRLEPVADARGAAAIFRCTTQCQRSPAIGSAASTSPTPSDARGHTAAAARQRDDPGERHRQGEQPDQPPDRRGAQQGDPPADPVEAQRAEGGEADEARAGAPGASGRRGRAPDRGAGTWTVCAPALIRPCSRLGTLAQSRAAPRRKPRQPLTSSVASIRPRRPRGRPSASSASGTTSITGPRRGRRARRSAGAWRRRQRRSWPQPAGREAEVGGARLGGRVPGHHRQPRMGCRPAEQLAVDRGRPLFAGQQQPAAAATGKVERQRGGGANGGVEQRERGAGVAVRASSTTSGRASPSACRRRSIRPAPRATAGQWIRLAGVPTR